MTPGQPHPQLRLTCFSLPEKPKSDGRLELLATFNVEFDFGLTIQRAHLYASDDGECFLEMRTRPNTRDGDDYRYAVLIASDLRDAIATEAVRLYNASAV